MVDLDDNLGKVLLLLQTSVSIPCFPKFKNHNINHRLDPLLINKPN